MPIVGITGGIAGGKSTVTAMFRARGARTRSADEDARAVLDEDDSLRTAVMEAFPEARAADGTIDRVRLGARIFADAEARARLESLMHPAIIARMRAAIEAARSEGRGVLVYETPLLYEAHLETLFDKVVAVLASPQAQRERLQTRERTAGRDPLTEDELTARLGAQIPPEEKARRADYIVRTDIPLADTEREVARIWQELAGA